MSDPAPRVDRPGIKRLELARIVLLARHQKTVQPSALDFWDDVDTAASTALIADCSQDGRTEDGEFLLVKSYLSVAMDMPLLDAGRVRLDPVAGVRLLPAPIHRTCVACRAAGDKQARITTYMTGAYRDASGETKGFHGYLCETHRAALLWV